MVTYTTNKGLALPAVGGDSGVWGGELNNSTTTPIDLILGGANTITLSATNYTLTSTDVQYLIQKLSGTLSANVTVYSSCSGFYFVENNTSGSHTVTWQANFGASNIGTGWVIPQGTRMLFVSDTTAGARPAPVQPSFTYTDIQEISTPAAPASGFMRFYAKTSGVMAAQTPGGTEYQIGKLPTVQRFTSGSGTYTPTAGTIRIRVRMVGGGGGGGSYGGTSGSTGGTTSFGAWTAIGGAGGQYATASAGSSAAGGTGGADGTGTKVCRIAGGYGGISSLTSGAGGSSVFGGCGGVTQSNNGWPAVANSGSGGGGAQLSGNCGGGGAPGEYVEFWMTASQIGAGLSYSVGAAGAGGLGTLYGGAGGAGIILVEEYFN